MARPSEGRKADTDKNKQVDYVATAGIVPRPLVQKKPSLSPGRQKLWFDLLRII